jgi:hypothetical protein
MAFLVVALGAGTATASPAQVDKPSVAPSGTYRLPAPAQVVASQGPDGKIHVAWSAVEGAVSYKLLRSVPPAPTAPVTLPNPADTQYVDSEVNPGSTYYYLVSAVNDAGIAGLNRSGSLRAEAPQAGLRSTTDPEAPAAGDSTPGSPVAAPTKVVAKPYPYLQATVSWQSSQAGVFYLVERRSSQGIWGRLQGPYGASSLWPCCEAIDRNPPVPADLYYRVTAIDTSPAHFQSSPVLSNPIYSASIRVPPPVIDAQQLVLGSSKWLNNNQFQAANLRAIHWRSINPAVVSVEREGLVTAQYVGRVYIIATGLTPGDEVQVFIWRIEVIPKP